MRCVREDCVLSEPGDAKAWLRRDGRWRRSLLRFACAGLASRKLMIRDI